MYARASGYLKMWYFDYGAHVRERRRTRGDRHAGSRRPVGRRRPSWNRRWAVVNVRKTELLQFAESTYNVGGGHPRVVSSRNREQAG